ncbi:hypothetical protein [Thermoflexibacter ruber]|uniref:hypothetical protein n=1 Tax=Thermoflexibacter ruber TaxID=1003 RepID=UPI001C869ED3|nr:hypothetical protein [Thermoflexibacter ruber]
MLSKQYPSTSYALYHFAVNKFFKIRPIILAYDNKDEYVYDVGKQSKIPNYGEG